MSWPHQKGSCYGDKVGGKLPLYRSKGQTYPWHALRSVSLNPDTMWLNVKEVGSGFEHPSLGWVKGTNSNSTVCSKIALLSAFKHYDFIPTLVAAERLTWAADILLIAILCNHVATAKTFLWKYDDKTIHLVRAMCEVNMKWHSQPNFLP